MKLNDFDFQLPDHLIAQHPARQRGESRLMYVKADGSLAHLHFAAMSDLLNSGDLLVRNNVKVMKARVYGEKASGGKLEFLIERILDSHRVLTQIRASKSPKQGDTLYMAGCACKVLAKHDGFYELTLALEAHGIPSIEALLEQVGHIPLPPYIRREDEAFDAARYQTVYAKETGAVAAPTAGLHFEQAHFEALKAKGVEIAETTLYVGSGTFQPVRVDNIAEHKMHSERYVVGADLVQAIQQCKHRGKRVVAIGTTSLRALESASQSGEIVEQAGETDIFIYPGYQFKCVDALITNFHLPQSSLLMLVSAFSGKENIKCAYQVAMSEGYRFFSYGDAMFLERAQCV